MLFLQLIQVRALGNHGKIVQLSIEVTNQRLITLEGKNSLSEREYELIWFLIDFGFL